MYQQCALLVSLVESDTNTISSVHFSTHYVLTGAVQLDCMRNHRMKALRFNHQSAHVLQLVKNRMGVSCGNVS